SLYGRFLNAARLGRIYLAECRFGPLYENATYRELVGRKGGKPTEASVGYRLRSSKPNVLREESPLSPDVLGSRPGSGRSSDTKHRGQGSFRQQLVQSEPLS